MNSRLGSASGGAGAFAERGFEVDGTAVLAQQIGERLVRKLLKSRHAVAGEQVERHPRLVVNGYALAGHAA